VVQAYGPRAAFVIDWLYALAERIDRRIMVRSLRARIGTPRSNARRCWAHRISVFTRKPNTDVSYIACARKLLA